MKGKKNAIIIPQKIIIKKVSRERKRVLVGRKREREGGGHRYLLVLSRQNQ